MIQPGGLPVEVYVNLDIDYLLSVGWSFVELHSKTTFQHSLLLVWIEVSGSPNPK